MNVMTRIVNSLPMFWEVFKNYVLPGSQGESEEEAPDEPPSKRRRLDNDHYLLGLQERGDEAKRRMHRVFDGTRSDDFLLCHDLTVKYPYKQKRKSRLESPVVASAHTESPRSDAGIVDKENGIVMSDTKNSSENDFVAGERPSQEDKCDIKAELKVIDLSSTPEFQNASEERATWLDARTSCRLFVQKDSKADKENDIQQLKVIAPSYLEKRIPVRAPPEFRAKIFNTTPKPLTRPEMSGGGGSSSLKRPNSNSLSSVCSSHSSLSGRKLPLLDQSIRLDEREKYSELLQNFTRVPVMKHSASQARHVKSPPLSFASHTRRRFGSTVEVIDLTSQAENKDGTTSQKLGNITKASALGEPTPCSELRKQLDKCKVYDVSWIEELTKMYNRRDRENRKRILEEKMKAALSTKRSEQLLHEILEEKVRVHLRLTEVAVEEGPVPIAEDEEPLPELTPEIEKRVSYAFKSGPGGEVLAEAFSLRITRRDMHTLVGTNWLNDEVINFYMNLLIERGKSNSYPSVYCFNTFFYPKLETQGHASLKRWTRRIDVFSHDLLIVPVHLGVHWCLACVNLKEKRILYYDSMGGKNNTCLQTLMKYLQDECVDKKKTRFNNSGWVMENVKDNPQQMNGSDCGMFSCMYAEYLCRGARINFSQSDMPYFRRKMAYEILSKKLML